MDVVTIYNMALGKVGTRTTVSATTEGSNESNSCNTFYDSLLRATLRAVPWNFARKQRLLTQLKSSADVPNTCPVPWAYEYTYPSDCLAARFIFPKVAATEIGGVPIDSSGSVALPSFVLGPPVQFIVSIDENSSGDDIKVILTNQYQAELVYTAFISDPNLFDPLFIEALTSALAAKVGRNLTADKELVSELKAETLKFLNDAAAENENEKVNIVDPVPDWMRVRGLAGDWIGTIGGYTNFETIYGSL